MIGFSFVLSSGHLNDLGRVFQEERLGLAWGTYSRQTELKEVGAIMGKGWRSQRAWQDSHLPSRHQCFACVPTLRWEPTIYLIGIISDISWHFLFPNSLTLKSVTIPVGSASSRTFIPPWGPWSLLTLDPTYVWSPSPLSSHPPSLARGISLIKPCGAYHSLTKLRFHLAWRAMPAVLSYCK